MKQGEPRPVKYAAYGSIAPQVRAALAAGATTPREIVVMLPGLRLNHVTRACLDMTASGVIVRLQDDTFRPTEHVMTEAAFQEFKRYSRRLATLNRKQQLERGVDMDRLAEIDAALRAWGGVRMAHAKFIDVLENTHG